MNYTYQPSQVVSYSEFPDQEVDWQTIPASGFLANQRWSPVRSLQHISNPATGDMRDLTFALKCTNFNISDLPDTISGLQLTTQAQRNGRIADEIVQLIYQDQLIGENQVNYLVDIEGHFTILNTTTYPGPWGVDLTPDILMDPSFGVMLKFQSHPFYPHNCGLFLDSVSITIV